MNEFFVHLRKDLRIQLSNSMLLLLLFGLVMLSIILAFNCYDRYTHSLASSYLVVSDHALEMARRVSLYQFWGVILGFFSLVFLVSSSFSLSHDKETGLAKYIMTYKASASKMYFSKLAVMLFLVLVSCILSLIVYVGVFLLLDSAMLGLDVLLLSMVFPFLTLACFVSIGLFISSLTSRKAAAAVLAVVVFFLVTFISMISTNVASMHMIWQHNGMPWEYVRPLVPIEYKLLIFSDPNMLREGTAQLLGLTENSRAFDGLPFFSALGDAIVGLGMIGLSSLLGIMMLSRERKDKNAFTWIVAGIKGLAKFTRIRTRSRANN